MRTDGLAAVLGPLASDPRVRAAALVDVDSGMVLDACGRDTDGGPGTEARGAAHAEIVRTASAMAPGPEDCEVIVNAGDGGRHVLRTVTDPHGGRLALAVVLADGAGWTLSRLRRRLRAVSAAALTAGPSMALRPTADGWEPNRLLTPTPPPPASPTGPDRPAGQDAATHSDRELLWVPSDPGTTPDSATASTVPAIVGIPVEPAALVPRRRPGSAWTAPPAPATPVEVDRHDAEDEPQAADLVPDQRRPAPPSALPPGLARPASPSVPTAPPVPAAASVTATPSVPAAPSAPAVSPTWPASPVPAEETVPGGSTSA
ncbi:hypothetical protein [Pseudonocardia endophytica]|uniref:hypothetical protein n=1 Tax=Pseudonocardia endophytica TaxID=401976 RepID=UPI0010495D1F|nr:hypothetical protein [Pseudonocardia endophytica]